jgi:hypothetical protein
MSDHKAESDLFALDVLPEPTVETRKPHILIVEHTNQGTEVTQGEPAYLFTIHYIVRHPDDCDPEECPITEHIEAVGLEDTLDLDSRHFADGMYELTYWSQHYSSPNGDDWDAGVIAEPVTSPGDQSGE